jgi:tetratricopeptide (TPR) repeat protein
MYKLKTFTTSLLLATTPTMLAYPQYTPPYSSQRVDYEEKSAEKDYVLSYDDMLHLLDEIESGELENRCTPEELERLKHFVAFLAKEGTLSDGSVESMSLDDDIEDLLDGENNIYKDAISFASPTEYQYLIVPAVLNGHGEIVLCKSWIKKKWDQVKKFVKKHKKEIIIGAVVVVAAAVVVVAVAAASSAAAGAAAGAAGAAGAAAGSSDSNHKSGENDQQASILAPADIPPGMAAAQEAPMLKSTIDHQISSFKETIVQNQFFPPANPGEQQSLSWQEDGRALGSLFAHDSYNSLLNQLPYHSGLAQEVQDINSKYSFPVPGRDQGSVIGHPEIDRKFSTDYSYLFSNPSQDIDFNALSHQVRGEQALSFGYYNQAVQDFGKAIETNPANPLPYLERGIAHFSLGQYDRSLEDYQQFISQTQIQKPNPLSVSEFSLGVAKGLPNGVYESGKGLFLFMTDFVKHPIQTSGQIVDSVTTLVNLVRNDEWGVVAETLSPEVHQLVTMWDVLSSEQKGELAGYALGKHGADILTPGAIAKVASKSVKSAQELAAVCKNLQIAQETLVLETVAEMGSSAKIAEVIRNGQSMAFLGEELGFTAQEMGQLQKLGKLEQAIDSTCESWLAKSPSEAYIAAKNGGKHARIITEFSGKPVNEIQKSIRSYEKLIAEHKDKIANPSKYCPDWDTFHPNRQIALVEKIWPNEIQCYTEQRDVLQTILNQRQ